MTRGGQPDRAEGRRSLRWGPFAGSPGARCPWHARGPVATLKEEGWKRKGCAVMGWNHDWGWAGWLPMVIGMTAFWIFVALLVLLAVRAGRRPDAEEPGPRQILEQRLARGEIDVEEYDDRLEALRRAGR